MCVFVCISVSEDPQNLSVVEYSNGNSACPPKKLNLTEHVRYKMNDVILFPAFRLFLLRCPEV